MAWVDALTLNHVWDQELDAPRFQHGFRTLAATRSSWPAPYDLLIALPSRTERPRLPQRPHDPDRAAKIIADLARELKKGVNK